MNETFDVEHSEGSGLGNVDMPIRKLSYKEYGSCDSEVGEYASLPSESASLDDSSSKQNTVKSTQMKSSKQKKPTFIDMIAEAIIEFDDKKGATVPAIKTYLRGTRGVGEAVMKANLKKAITKGEEKGVFIRPSSSKGSKGLTGRLKINPEYAKMRRKEESMKAAPKNSETKKPRKKKSPAAAVSRKNLKSLQEKPLAVKLAQEKIKQARKSIGFVPLRKPKVMLKKLEGANPPKKNANPSKKNTTPRRSPEVTAKKGKPRKAVKSIKGASK